MSEAIVNLRRARKERDRKRRETEAEANRRRFGRTKAEKQVEEAARKRRVQLIEGARRDRDKAKDDGGQ
jgi:hypothetical protein